MPDGDSVVPRCNALMARHDLVVVTQAWHPPRHHSFASTPDREPYDTIDLAYGPQVQWPDHCVQGTVGATMHPDLELDRAHLIVRKGWRPEIDSDSAFTEHDRRTSTGLAAALAALGVDRVVLCGLATDFCVKYTALDAVGAELSVTVVASACRGIDLDGSVGRAWDELAAAGVERAG